MTEDTDIVIVGAGAAGIGAARGLAGKGFRVVMLEALPRIGGRAWTHRAAGVPLDMGCAYLHSAERNPWVPIAEEMGAEIDRSDPAWNVFSDSAAVPHDDRRAAREAFGRWSARVQTERPASDCAADLLDPADARWHTSIGVLCGFISGVEPDRISVADLAAYDAASTDTNWRLPGGYGTLVAAALPEGTDLRLSTPVEAVTLTAGGVACRTPRGELRARAAILTVSTNVLAAGRIGLPRELDPWREAAGGLPLGNDEKLFFEVLDRGMFTPETHFNGPADDPLSAAFYVMPHGKPVIDFGIGGAAARAMAEEGREAAEARALDQFAEIFGSGVRQAVRPLVATDWTRTPEIGGGYSCALPGRAAGRAVLARPYDGRIFFAGEATHPSDYSTAHGALISGLRAAAEVRSALPA